MDKRKTKLHQKIDDEMKSHKYQTAYFLILKYRNIYKDDKETTYLMAKACFYLNMPEETIKEIDRYFSYSTKIEDPVRRVLSCLKAKSLKKLSKLEEMQELIEKVRKSIGWKDQEEEIKKLMTNQPFVIYI